MQVVYNQENAASILLHMGFKIDVDFIATGTPSGVVVEWLSNQPAPAQTDLDAAEPQMVAAAIQRDLTAELESHYDKTAQQRRYDNRLTCALRAGYAGPFQAEGQAFAIWMDTCNAYAYQVMADCLAGTRPAPTAAELIAELPPMLWPA